MDKAKKAEIPETREARDREQTLPIKGNNQQEVGVELREKAEGQSDVMAKPEGEKTKAE